jgi:hypothetical protein
MRGVGWDLPRTCPEGFFGTLFVRGICPKAHSPYSRSKAGSPERLQRVFPEELKGCPIYPPSFWRRARTSSTSPPQSTYANCVTVSCVPSKPLIYLLAGDWTAVFETRRSVSRGNMTYSLPGSRSQRFEFTMGNNAIMCSYASYVQLPRTLWQGNICHDSRHPCRLKIK